MNYIEQSLIETSAAIECVFISAFASLVGIFIDSTSSAVGLKTCITIASITDYKPIIEKKGKARQNRTASKR